jgi:hypothetical protein
MFRPILICAGLVMAGLGNAAAGGEDAPSQSAPSQSAIAQSSAAQPAAVAPQAEQALREQTLPSPKEWLAKRQAEFEAYEISLEAEKPRKLVLESRSLLNWSNAERGADVGAVFLWTDRGRPQLIACAFGRDKLLRHEFHSLSTEPIVAQRGGEAVHRFGPGALLQDLPAAPGAGEAVPPAKQRALRLTQMRRQAERFRVVMGGKQPAEMRQLTQPIYRTPAELEDDIALFAFVQGTDPECLLMLEATSEGKWRYGVMRQTKWPLKVELDSKEIADFHSLGRTPAESPFFVLKPPSAVE